MVDFLGRDFPFEVNHKIVVKLNTGCVQNVVTAWLGRLGWPLLWTDEKVFFKEPVTLTPTGPTWIRSMFSAPPIIVQTNGAIELQEPWPPGRKRARLSDGKKE